MTGLDHLLNNVFDKGHGSAGGKITSLSLDSGNIVVTSVPVVDLVMLVEVVRPGKPLATNGASVGFDPRV